MTQADRDRLVTLKKAQQRLVTQEEAARELGITARQVRRLLYGLKKRGDPAVMHGLRGLPSNRRIPEEVKAQAIGILSEDTYRGFRPTLACEHLRDQHELEVSRETLRQWMKEAGLWRSRRQPIPPAHLWRQRRSRCGELVQWDSSEHDWLEGRAERLYLIAMIDDATSRLYARFASRDSTEENMRTLWNYLLRYGRPAAFYTDKASLFRTAEKRRRDEPGVDKDPVEMPPTQIGRALRELHITWIAAHSPQAKGRIERSFGTAQDRLVKGMRLAGVKTLEQANAYLEREYLPWWDQTRTVVPAHREDAHRPLEKQHNLAAILSHVESRHVKNDYTIQFQGKRYGIERADIGTGLRGSAVRVEKRQDGTVAIRFRDRYLRSHICEPAQPMGQATQTITAAADRVRRAPKAGGKSQWMKGFFKTQGPSLKKALATSNATS